MAEELAGFLEEANQWGGDYLEGFGRGLKAVEVGLILWMWLFSYDWE